MSEKLVKALKKLEKSIDRQGNLLTTLEKKVDTLAHMDMVLEYLILSSIADKTEQASNMAAASVHRLEELKAIPENESKITEIENEMKKHEQNSLQFAFLWQNAIAALQECDKHVMPWLYQRYPILSRTPQQATQQASQEMKCSICGKPTAMVANGKPTCAEHYAQVMGNPHEKTMEDLKKERLRKMEEESEDGDPSLHG